MDFGLSYTPEQVAFAAEVRAWIAAHVPADLVRWPATAQESADKYETRRALGRELGRIGWLYAGAPREYGGGGLPIDLVVVLEEEFHRVGLRLPPYYDAGGRIGAATILVWGTPEQRARFLPPIYRGEVRTWQLLSEPGAGSDLAGVSSLAIRDGDEYVLNGQKVYAGSGNGADRFWVIAVTDPDAPRHQNLGWFMVDSTLPGITVVPQPLLSTVGEGEADIGHKNTIFFDDVRIPADCLIGGENNGWAVATTHLDVEHGAMGTIARDRTWDRLLEHCLTTSRDGVPLVDDPDVRDALADVFVNVEKVRLLGTRNFWQARAGEKRSYEGSQLEHAKKQYGLAMTRSILDALGPSALTTDDEVGAMEGFAEEQQREGIVYMHPGGTAEIHRLIIARRLGLGRDVAERAGRLAASGSASDGAGD